MDSVVIRFILWPSSRLSFLVHSILKGVILDAANVGVPWFPFPLVGEI